MAAISNVALTNTFDTWRIRSNQVFARVNQFATNESALYANTLTANVAFTSKGLATLQGRATVGTNLTVTGNTTLGVNPTSRNRFNGATTINQARTSMRAARSTPEISVLTRTAHLRTVKRWIRSVNGFTNVLNQSLYLNPC